MNNNMGTQAASFVTCGKCQNALMAKHLLEHKKNNKNDNLPLAFLSLRLVTATGPASIIFMNTSHKNGT